MGYVNKCYEDTCGTIAPHFHYEYGHRKLYNFEQFACEAKPGVKVGAHSIITVYTRKWYGRKINWLKCIYCQGRWRVY